MSNVYTGERKEVILKDGDKYVRVPLNALYVEVAEDKNNIREQFTHPIKKFERRGDNFIVTNHIRRVHLPLRVVEADLQTRVRQDLNINQVQYKVIERAIQKMGGMRFKTTIGVDWKIPGRIYTGGRIEFDPSKARLLNSRNNRALCMPNLYHGGDICWGYVSAQKKWGTNYADGVEHFFTFMGTVFNQDLSFTERFSNSELKNWLRTRLKEVEHEDQDVQQARQSIADKLVDRMNVITLLVIATVFDEDNVKIDSMLNRR